MLTFKTEEKITPIVRKFVESLNDQYKKDCSNNFLVALIMCQLSRPHREGTVAEAVIGNNLNPAYDSVCWLFEGVLEGKCRAGGNGHHVAQRFAKAMEEIVGLQIK